MTERKSFVMDFQINLFNMSKCRDKIHEFRKQLKILPNDNHIKIKTLNVEITEEYEYYCAIHNSLMIIITESINSNKIITDRNLRWELLTLFYELLHLSNQTPPLTCNLITVDLESHIKNLDFKEIIYINFIYYMKYTDNPDNTECSICLESPKKKIIPAFCCHTYCEECMYKSIETLYADKTNFTLKNQHVKPRCAICRKDY